MLFISFVSSSRPAVQLKQGKKPSASLFVPGNDNASFILRKVLSLSFVASAYTDELKTQTSFILYFYLEWIVAVCFCEIHLLMNLSFFCQVNRSNGSHGTPNVFPLKALCTWLTEKQIGIV